MGKGEIITVLQSNNIQMPPSSINFPLRWILEWNVYTHIRGGGEIFKLSGCEGPEALDSWPPHQPPPLHSHLQNPWETSTEN